MKIRPAADTMHRICQDAGAPEDFTETFAALAARKETILQPGQPPGHFSVHVRSG